MLITQKSIRLHPFKPQSNAFLLVLDTQACDMVAMAQEAICFQSFLDFLQNKLANSTRIRMQRIKKGKLFASFIVVSNFHKYANLYTCFSHYFKYMIQLLSIDKNHHMYIHVKHSGSCFHIFMMYGLRFWIQFEVLQRNTLKTL